VEAAGVYRRKGHRCEAIGLVRNRPVTGSPRDLT
jgi:hypothetical protein